MAEDKNELTAWVLLITPAIIVAILHSIIPAASHYVDLTWEKVVMYLTALALGFLLFRRSRKVLDHEFFRAKSIKGLRKAYTAEDRGLWTKADSAMAQLERDAEGYLATDDDAGRDKGKRTDELAGRSMSEKTEEKEPELEIRMLSEEEHVRRSTGRMSGEGLEDPMDAMAASDLAHERRQAASPANVDANLQQALKDEDSARTQKVKETAAPAPVVAKPKPKPKPEPKPASPQEYEQIYGGGKEPAGVTVEGDKDMASLAASTGGGGGVGKETKFCLDCGARNPISRDYCSNCSALLT